MKDYITSILVFVKQRVKKCAICGTTFFDSTKPHNRAYCSIKCRNHAQEQKQERKIYLHRYYLRKTKTSRNILMRNLENGTMFTDDLKTIRINGQLRIKGALKICL